MVNALQRRADVVAQMSLAEGFGLTVAEAMWKARPVVATRVGGIQDQIEDGRTGHLVEPHDLAAFGAQVSALLNDPHDAERIGQAAQARVRDAFLGPRHLGQYVELLERVLTEAAPRHPDRSPLMTPATARRRHRGRARTCRPRLPARAPGGLRHRLPRVPLAGGGPVQLGARLVRRAGRRGR